MPLFVILFSVALTSIPSFAAPKPSFVALSEAELTKIYQAAIDDPARAQAERDADKERRPMELLKLSHVKPGDVVVDFLPGKGYFTHLFSKVVGNRGKVFAFVPEELKEAKFKPVDSANEAAKGYENVTVIVAPLLKLQVKNANLFWTSLNYHDLYTKNFSGLDTLAFNKEVFSLLKQNGNYLVVDHAANEGTPNTEADRLHRIDPKNVKSEILQAGFQFAEESAVLKHSEDPRTLTVFDPSIKGKTDQFAFRFLKPVVKAQK